MFVKKLKIVGIIIVSTFLLYSLFVAIEVMRFNNNLGAKPIIILSEEETASSSTQISKEYYGLGYTIKYEYYVKIGENSNILSGEFKLFGKTNISAWIQ